MQEEKEESKVVLAAKSCAMLAVGVAVVSISFFCCCCCFWLGMYVHVCEREREGEWERDRERERVRVRERERESWTAVGFLLFALEFVTAISMTEEGHHLYGLLFFFFLSSQVCVFSDPMCDVLTELTNTSNFSYIPVKGVWMMVGMKRYFLVWSVSFLKTNTSCSLKF